MNTNPLFLQKIVSVDTSSILSLYWSPTAEGVAPAVIERWVVNLFLVPTSADFFLYLLESRKCNAGILPITPRNWEEKHIQPIRKKEKVKNRFDWCKSKGNKIL
jgi:hypothetical protein